MATMTAIRVSLVLLGLFNFFVHVTCVARPEGSDCLIAGKPGVCKKISDCSSAWTSLVCYNVKPLYRDVCCFSLKEKVVCCPKTDPPKTAGKLSCVERDGVDPLVSTATKAVAKSIEMCETYSGLKSQLRTLRVDGQGEVSQHLNRAGRSLNSSPAGNLDVEFDENLIDPRITNGARAVDSEFPHMAAIGFNETDGEIIWSCGGTLISDQYVLTAGHCLQNRGSVASWVQLGSTKLNVDDPTNRYRVVERIAHPDYKPPSLYNDIALLRLDLKVTFDHAIHPACLQTQRVSTGLACTATGWGVTDWENPAMNKDLLKVLLRVQRAAQCNDTFQPLIKSGTKLVHGVIDESTICAGDPGGANDTCQGDSGGPIMVSLKGTEDMYVVIGITSFGNKACGSGAPALYTRVSHFVPWIVGHVWPPPPPPRTQPSLKSKSANMQTEPSEGTNSSVWIFT